MNETSESADFYHSAESVRRRYDVCDMTLRRWQNDPRMKFPPPEYFGRSRKWLNSVLTKWERTRPAREAAK
jgi:hypothetical protein